MKKVLIVLTGGLKADGITLSLIDLLNNLPKGEFEIDVLNNNDASNNVLNKFTNVKCNVIKTPNRRRNVIKYLRFFNKLLKNKNYDIIHVHGSSYIMSLELSLAKKNNVKLRIAHSRNTKTNNILLHYILKRKFFKSYNCAVACGNDAGKWLFKNKTFEIIYNGKDLNELSFDYNVRNKIRSEINPNDYFAIGHVGNFNTQKNHEFLIDIFNNIHKNNQKTILYLFGDGSLRKTIEGKVKELKLEQNVLFLGSVSNINEYLQAMDLMLLPSLFEGLPNVVVEWQANGLKSFISDKITKEVSVGNLVDFLPIDEGIKIWVDKIEEFIKNSDNYDRIYESKNNIKILKEKSFDIKKTAQMIADLYLKEGE